MRRREVLQAVMSVPVVRAAAVIPSALSVADFKVLALAASRPPTTNEEYITQRTYTDTELYVIVDDLVDRGLLERHYDRPDISSHYVIPTDVGLDELRRIGALLS